MKPAEQQPPSACEPASDAATPWRAVVDATPIFIGVLELDGRLREANRAALEFVGVVRDDVIGLPFADTIWWRDDRAGRERLHAAIENASRGESARFDVRHQSADGTRGTFDFMLAPMRGPDGSVASLVATAVDVTVTRGLAAEVARAEAFGRQLFERNRSIMLFIEPRTGRIRDANPAAVAFYGYDRATLCSMRIHDINAQGPAAVDAAMARAETDQRSLFEFRHRLASGEVRDVEVRTGPLERDGATLLYSIIHDVTASRAVASDARLAWTVVEQARDAIVVTELDGVVRTANRAFARLTGLEHGALAGQPVAACLRPLARAALRQAWTSVAGGATWQGELQVPEPAGLTVTTYHLSLSAVRDESGAVTHVLGVFSDVDEQARARERLELLAHHDPLTGLCNRANFDEEVEKSVARHARSGSPFAVVFVDLDHFKQVNDEHGHAAGDAALVETARRLTAGTRRSDTVARVGGDEFVLLLDDIGDSARLPVLLERIRASLEKPLGLEDAACHLSASMGVAVFPADGSDPSSLVRNADAAMYAAKRSGRNCIVWHTEAS